MVIEGRSERRDDRRRSAFLTGERDSNRRPQTPAVAGVLALPAVVYMPGLFLLIDDPELCLLGLDYQNCHVVRLFRLTAVLGDFGQQMTDKRFG